MYADRLISSDFQTMELSDESLLLVGWRPLEEYAGNLRMLHAPDPMLLLTLGRRVREFPD
jgi:hypothetical protein